MIFALLVGWRPSFCQDPYGAGTPGSAGLVPTLGSNQAWMGNSAFGFQIGNALGGALAVVAVSAQPATLAVGQTQVLISLAPSDVQLIDSFILGGPAGMPGAGAGSYLLPLSFPVNPVLAGLVFFAQAGISDYPMPGMFAATQGLRVEVTMPPLIAVVTVDANYAPTVHFIDPSTMSAAFAPLTLPPNQIRGVAFAHGGRDLFISRSGAAGIDRIDLSGVAPVLSTFFQGGPCRGLALDRVHDLLYTGEELPGTTILRAIDANPASPAFGQAIASVTLPPSYDIITVSPDGILAAITTYQCPANTLSILDVDPASPTYLQTLSSGLIPQQSCSLFGPRATGVVITRDGQFAYVMNWSVAGVHNLPHAEAGIARYHIPTASWTDFNPGMPGTQNIGNYAPTPFFFMPSMTDLDLSRDGSFGFVPGQGFVTRFDFDTAGPGTFTATTSGTISNIASNALSALAPDDSILVIARWNTLEKVDPSTLAQSALITLPTQAYWGTPAIVYR